MNRSAQALDFQAKLSALFDEADAFSCDAEKQERVTNFQRRSEKELEPLQPKPTKPDLEPGCLPFTVRRMRAEANPSLKDFFRRFQDKGKRKTSK
jgi:hypothetical protein